MSREEESKVPAIRFRGFEGEWEKLPLHRFADRFDNLRIPIAESNRIPGSTPYYGANGIQDWIAGFTHEGEFVLIAEDGANDIENYPVHYVSGQIWVNNHAHVLQAKSKRGDTSFLSYACSGVNFKEFIVGGSRAKLNAATLMDIEFSSPSTVLEQTKIGCYFQKLDKLLALHQRKHDKLVKLKQAMLHAMFPRDGATTPEVRFQGFEGDWEEKRLGDLFPITSAARVHKNEWTTSGVPFFRSSDVVSAFRGQANTKAFISRQLYEELTAKVGRIKEGDMLVTGGGSIGVPYLVPSDEPLYFKDADLLWFKIRDSVDSRFLYTYFSSDPFAHYVKSISHIGTIAHYTVEQAKETPLLAPAELPEQQKIGAYFRTLDTLISQHATQLTKLKQLKSACLERMFV